MIVSDQFSFQHPNDTPVQNRHLTPHVITSATETSRNEDDTMARMKQIESKYDQEAMFEKFDQVIDNVINEVPSTAKKDRNRSWSPNEVLSRRRSSPVSISQEDALRIGNQQTAISREDEEELFKLSQFLTKRGGSLDATPEHQQTRPSLPQTSEHLRPSQLKSVYKPPLPQDGKSPIYCPNTVDKKFDDFVEDLL